MEKNKKQLSDQKYCIALGKKISLLIKEKGYKSPYAFWLENGEDGLSRSNLNYIINGKTDPKLSTLRKIADGLEVELVDLFKNI